MIHDRVSRYLQIQQGVLSLVKPDIPEIPERLLWLMVILRALYDATDWPLGNMQAAREKRRERYEAQKWIMGIGSEEDHVGSLKWISEFLSDDPEVFVEKIQEIITADVKTEAKKFRNRAKAHFHKVNLNKDKQK